MEDKVTRDEVRKLTSDKITKDDIEQLIPNEEIMQEKMKYLIRDELEAIQNRLMDQLKIFDSKLVRLRQDIDVHSI